MDKGNLELGKIPHSRAIATLTYQVPTDYDPPMWTPAEDEDMDPDETVFVVGQRRTGKTTLVVEVLLRLRRQYSSVFIFTNTKHNNFLQQIAPDSRIIEGVDEEMLQEILSIQADRMSKWKRTKRDSGKCEGNPYLLIMFEDCVNENMLRKSKVLETIMLNGRHFGICCWVLSQTFTGLTKTMRINMDRFIVFKPTDIQTREFIRVCFGAYVVLLIDRVTSEPHQALVINNKASVTKDRLFRKYKADKDWLDGALHKNLHLGNKKWWGDIDIKAQKEEFPYITKMPARATLEAQFERVLGGKDSEETTGDDFPGMTDAWQPPEPAAKKKREPAATWGDDCLLL